jgi:hypothetical protein
MIDTSPIPMKEPILILTILIIVWIGYLSFLYWKYK